MQALLNEIHRVTGADGSALDEAKLSVAYNRPLDFYLTECLAMAVTAAGHDDPAQRVEVARALEPEWTEQLLRGQPIMPAGVTGARLGLFLCALGIDPFAVDINPLAGPVTTQGVNMDSLQYRATRLATAFKWFQTNGGGTQSMEPLARKYTKPAAPLAEDPQRGFTRADMPVEFLMAMIRMLHHTAVTRTLRQSLTELIPAWYIDTNPAQLVARKVYRRASNRPNSEFVYTASLGEPSAASALMRAVVVVELARQHAAPGSPELAALPRLLDWDIHRLSAGNDALTISYAFSVVVEKGSAENTDGGDVKLNAFMHALLTHTGAFPVSVPATAAALSKKGGLVLSLEAFIGAQWPGLPQYDMARSTLWRSRRSQPNNAAAWFGKPAAVSAPAGDLTYRFDTSGFVAKQQMVQASISYRLQVNPWCRQCATPLPVGSATLTCAGGTCRA